VSWQLRTRALGLNVFIPLVAVVLALATVALLLVAVGSNPLDAYRDMWNAALGDRFALSTTVTKTMPRLLAALGIALALRAGLWNIGAEGQLYVGALATTAVALYEPDLGAPVMIATALVAGALAGAGWAMIPGVLRAKRGVSEVITSLMLVYIGIQLTNYVLESPWAEPGSTFPSSPYVPPGASLPTIVSGTLLNAGALVGLVLVAVAWFLMSRSTFGLRLNAIGGNERAARIAGVRVSLMIVLAMAASGAFAGLAGGMEVLGVRGRLVEGFSPGYGFEAIAIALLGRLNAFGILGAALLFGALDAGSAGLQTAAQGVPASISQVAEGLAVAYVLVGLGLASIIQRRRAARAALREAAKGPAAGEPDVLPIAPESVVDS
jgi:general nucleoside transport system permease protein